MIFLYGVFSTLLYPFLFIFIFIRLILGKEDPIRYKEKILISNFAVNKRDNSKLIWFHAASVGEFKSILPIINQLNMGKNIEAAFISGKKAADLIFERLRLS